MFVLFDRGRLIAEFAHRRLREKPPSGGVSVLCESVPVDPILRRSGEQLLAPLGWHGVAMLEFKRDAVTRRSVSDRSERPLLGLAAARRRRGVDFPALAAQLALGQASPAPPRYREGVQSRWLLGDLDHLLLRLRRTRSANCSCPTTAARARGSAVATS